MKCFKYRIYSFFSCYDYALNNETFQHQELPFYPSGAARNTYFKLHADSYFPQWKSTEPLNKMWYLRFSRRWKYNSWFSGNVGIQPTHYTAQQPTKPRTIH